MSGRIVVFGAGLVGCYVGGRLAAATGTDVTLIGRPALASELVATPLRVTDCDGADLVCTPDRPKVETDPEALCEAELVLVTVKSGATPEAGQAIARYAPSASAVISLQNGIDNADHLRAALPGRRVLAGMVPFNVTRPSPGRFHRGTGGRLAVQDDPAIAPWIDVFAAAGLPLATHSDMRPILWGKLVINLNNAVNALSGLALADQLADRAYRRVWACAMREALVSIRADGVVPAAYNGRSLGFVTRILLLPDPAYALATRLSGTRVDPLARSSMADDLRDRRLTEIDYINGAVVRLARRLGREAPVNAALVRLVHQAEKGAASISGPALLRAINERR